MAEDDYADDYPDGQGVVPPPAQFGPQQGQQVPTPTLQRGAETSRQCDPLAGIGSRDSEADSEALRALDQQQQRVLDHPHGPRLR